MGKRNSLVGISRRALLKGSAGATALLAAPMLMRGIAVAQDKTLFVGTYGGPWQAAEEAAFYKPFTERTGIQVRPVQGVSLAKVKAQVQSGNYDFDITDIEYLTAEYGNLVEPIDFSVIDTKNIPKESIVRNGFRDVVLSTVLIYRKDKFPNGGPKNWADFWDVKKFPGKRSLGTRANTVCEQALLADGVPRDKVYPLDVDRAMKKLGEIKPNILVWWTQAAQSQQLIRDGEVDMMAIWSSGAQRLVADGLPIEIVWDGAHIESGGCFYVPKGDPRSKMAFQYLETYMDPKLHAQFASTLGYGPGNALSFQYMTKEQIERSPNSPEKLAVGVVPDYEWLTPRFDDIKAKFAEFIAA